ncbi:MAG: tRNA lysidine(34) synthetase TilS [Oscillospiraceae bacterium]|nr:tRNA lysidine(34) synthetase TilS [Oscillospiraceae bacterium]
MIEKIRGTIQKYGMLQPGGHVVAGISGGADSVALLHVLISLKQEFGLFITAAHLNHNLRGGESLRDENFVKDFCKRLGVDLIAERLDIAKISKNRGISLEEAGRDARYEFFSLISNGKNARIAVAHNLNDSAETVILNFARGTALRGLCGIPPVRGSVIRPLIACSRDEIEKYCDENSLCFVTDSTNLDPGFTRNRIRHFVMPQLLAVNPGLFGTVQGNLEALRADSRYLEQTAQNILNGMLLPNGAVDRAKYLETESCLRSRILRIMLSGHRISADNKRLLRLDAIALAGSGAEQLSPETYFMADKKSFRLSRPKPVPGPFCIPIDLQGGKIQEIYVFSNKKLRIINTDYEYYEENIKYNRNLLKNAVDYDKIVGTAVIRQKHDGDKIRLTGRNCTKTLKKLFYEAGIPSPERGKILILSDGLGPVWIEGFGVAERCSVSGETSKVSILGLVP